MALFDEEDADCEDEARWPWVCGAAAAAGPAAPLPTEGRLDEAPTRPVDDDIIGVLDDDENEATEADEEMGSDSLYDLPRVGR